MPRPMRHSQRQRLLRQAMVRGEREAAAELTRLLQQRYKVLTRELRRANLRKRLEKANRDNTDMNKAIGVDWKTWVSDFTDSIRGIVAKIVEPLKQIEYDYWQTYGKDIVLPPGEDVVSAYEARTGRNLSDIAEGLHENVINEIQQWYSNRDESLPELIDRLEKYFNEDKANQIAATESTYAASEVAYDSMNQAGVGQWNLVLAPEENGWPCQLCKDVAANNPHELGDDMPPYHPHDRCGVDYIMQ